MRKVRRAWNGGSREAALKAAHDASEAAIASGWERCPGCGGSGRAPGLPPTVCPQCGGAGFLVPSEGMPLPPNPAVPLTDDDQPLGDEGAARLTASIPKAHPGAGVYHEPRGSQFRCAVCRNVFVKGLPDDEALAELTESFPGFTPDECHLVCDDCYRAMGLG